jgi:hypothetical protein
MMVNESKLMFGKSSLIVMMACALLWAMILPETPDGLMNSQQE